jgi:hypothetical protein
VAFVFQPPVFRVPFIPAVAVLAVEEDALAETEPEVLLPVEPEADIPLEPVPEPVVELVVLSVVVPSAVMPVVFVPEDATEPEAEALASVPETDVEAVALAPVPAEEPLVLCVLLQFAIITASGNTKNSFFIK